MGGRGSGGGAGIGGGSGKPLTILESTDMISMRGRQEREVDEVLTVMRDVQEQYNEIIEQAVVSKLAKKDNDTMAYWSGGILGINENYFNAERFNLAYDVMAKNGFHPPMGNKSALEATTAHELGHALTDAIGERLGIGDIDKTARRIVGEALKAKNKAEAKSMARGISEYASKYDAECVAEAFCDVYCIGNNANSASKKIVNVMNKYLK